MSGARTLRVISRAGRPCHLSEVNEMAIGTIVIVAVSLLLLIYLTVALLRPEKF